MCLSGFIFNDFINEKTDTQFYNQNAAGNVDSSNESIVYFSSRESRLSELSSVLEISTEKYSSIYWPPVYQPKTSNRSWWIETSIIVLVTLTFIFGFE